MGGRVNLTCINTNIEGLARICSKNKFRYVKKKKRHQGEIGKERKRKENKNEHTVLGGRGGGME